VYRFVRWNGNRENDQEGRHVNERCPLKKKKIHCLKVGGTAQKQEHLKSIARERGSVRQPNGDSEAVTGGKIRGVRKLLW